MIVRVAILVKWVQDLGLELRTEWFPIHMYEERSIVTGGNEQVTLSIFKLYN